MQIEHIDDEPGRLRALRRYGVLDPGREHDFDPIIAIVSQLFRVPICGVSLIDQDEVWFHSLGWDRAYNPRSISFCDHAIRSTNMTVVPDATKDRRFAANPLVTGEPGIRSYAGVPLLTPDGYNLGTLCAVDCKPRRFSSDQLRTLEQLAVMVMQQLELRTLAHEDFLTSVLTRRAFTHAAERLIGGEPSGGRGASIATFDIDHFKQVNDHHGHAIGDRVLQAVAAECRSLLRPGDIIGRLGGEEFGVLLPATDAAVALGCAERLRSAIETLRPPGCPSVTASFGISELREKDDTASWLARADKALYAAKRSGRNVSIVSGLDLAAAA